MKYETYLWKIRLRKFGNWALTTLVDAVLDIAVAYFFVLWGLERLAIESGLEFYPDQTFVNACYLCAILWGIKAIK